jgi:glutaredoxin 3
MNALVYSKENCPYCVKAKALLVQKNISFMEVKIGDDMLREDFIAMFPEQRTVPLIFVNGVKIGGHYELVEYFNTPGPEFLAG